MGIVNYLRETKAEMGQVTWPSRFQTATYTLLVIALAIGLAALLGAFDVLFNWLVKVIWQ